MQTLQQTFAPTYTHSAKRSSVITRFFDWCKSQEQYRFGWLAVILAFHGCVLSPITVLLVALAGNSMILWALAMSSMAAALVTNLAAMPTKVTIPVFFATILVDLAVIAICLNVTLT